MKAQADVSLACKFGVIRIKTEIRQWRLCEREDEEREEFVQELHLVELSRRKELRKMQTHFDWWGCFSSLCWGSSQKQKHVHGEVTWVPRVECLFPLTSEQVLLVWLTDERSWNLCMSELPCCDQWQMIKGKTHDVINHETMKCFICLRLV